MKAADIKIIAAALASYNVDADLVKACDVAFGGQGIFRGGHNLSAHDFSGYRVDYISGVNEGKPVYETLEKKGKLLEGLKPVLMLSCADLSYTPFAGEHLIVYREATDDYSAAVMQGVIGKQLLVAGNNGEAKSGWSLQITVEDALVPVHRVTPAGVVTTNAIGHMLANRDNDEVDELAEQLAAKNLTFSDLYVAKTTSAEGYVNTAFYKRLGKKAGLTAEHDLVASLLAGEPVALPKKAAPAKAKQATPTKAADAAKPAPAKAKQATKEVPAKEAPAKQATSKAATKAPRVTTADEVVALLTAQKGTAFAALYLTICTAAKVAVAEHKTKRGEMLKHATELLASKTTAKAVIAAVNKA